MSNDRSASPNQIPEQRVGRVLREARQEAGLSLREMARRLDYGSHSTLSEYENGARMPSEAVVDGYERLLGLGRGTLTDILSAANIQRHGDAWPKRRPHRPAGAAAMPDTAFPRQPVRDGSDPDAAGCYADAVTVHSRRMAFTSNKVVVGHVELRHSQHTNAVWGRFEGYSSLNHTALGRPDVNVMIVIERYSDGAAQTTVEPYCFDLMWGNLLHAGAGLFLARAMVLFGREPVAEGETDACVLS